MISRVNFREPQGRARGGIARLNGPLSGAALRFLAALLPFLGAGCSSPEERPPVETNAAVLYLRAFDLLDQAGEEGRRVMDEGLHLVSNDKPYDPVVWSGPLDACAPALAEMESASRLDRCQFAGEYELDQELPWLPRARKLTRLNSVWAWQLVRTGRGAQAVPVWRRGFALARHLAREGGVVGGLVAIAVAGITMDTIRRSLIEDMLDPATLRSLANLLAEQQYGIASLAAAMRGEKTANRQLGERWMKSEDPFVAFDEYIHNLLILPAPRPKTPLDKLPPRERQMLFWFIPPEQRADKEATRKIFKAEIEFFLDTFNELERLGDLPYDQALTSIRDLERFGNQVPELRKHTLTAVFTTANLSALKSRMKTESKRRGLLGMIEIRLFMREHGRVPNSADNLKIPADTCSGKPMSFEVTAQEVILRCDIDEHDPENERRDPFYAGVFRLPIPPGLPR